MKDEPDPPRKYYTFKESEFVRVNKPLSGSPGDGTDINDVPIDLQELYRAANSAPVKKPTAPQENEIHAMLRHNHAKAEAAGLNVMRQIPSKKSKRRRDFFVMLFGGNALVAPVLAWFLGFQMNAGLLIIIVSCTAGIIIYNVGLFWIMWMVMDDY